LSLSGKIGLAPLRKSYYRIPYYYPIKNSRFCPILILFCLELENKKIQIFDVECGPRGIQGNSGDVHG
jgi:hypothetical protein